MANYRLSKRRRAAIRMAELYRVAIILANWGNILDPGPWLIVLANTLSSAPGKWLGNRRGPTAPEYFGLSNSSLAWAARRAGLHAPIDQIATQVAATKAWRERESQRIGRKHFIPMKPATIGRLLGVTAIIRLEAKAWSIIPYGCSKEQMTEQRRARERQREHDRRQEKGATTRELALSRTKPWARSGISRATWFRQQAATAKMRLIRGQPISETDSCETDSWPANKGGETDSWPANKDTTRGIAAGDSQPAPKEGLLQ